MRALIRGVITPSFEAVVRLRVRAAAGGSEVEVDSVVDSGFSASLTLPASTLSQLGAPRIAKGQAILADGSIRTFYHHKAQVLWDGRWNDVLVYAAGEGSLLGMRMMTGYSLRVDVMPGGAVEITNLS